VVIRKFDLQLKEWVDRRDLVGSIDYSAKVIK